MDRLAQLAENAYCYASLDVLLLWRSASKLSSLQYWLITYDLAVAVASQSGSAHALLTAGGNVYSTSVLINSI